MLQRLGKRGVLAWIGAMALVSGVAHAPPLAAAPWPRQALGHGADGIAFVDNRLCQPCHPQVFQDWLGSHHEQAMQPATTHTVRGDFHNTSFTHQGITSRFFTSDGKYVVNTEGPDGQMADFEIPYTFGVEPLQQYLIPLPGGRLQSFPVAWDTQKQRWFHLYPQENAKPGEAFFG